MKTVLILIWIHFVADFVLQSDKVALKKSSNVKIMGLHVAIYSFAFVIFGPFYCFVNAAFHMLVDGVSSKLTSYLWKRDQRHWFFVVIGLDQAIHMTCLILTIPVMM